MAQPPPAEPLNLEKHLEQLGRALQNPNMAASVEGSDESQACLDRIQATRDAIEAANSADTPAQQPQKATKKKKK
jgi:hypothetical protein